MTAEGCNCNTLQHTATHCNTRQHTATHCNTLQHTATHIRAHDGGELQHTSLPFISLQFQYTTKHCNALQHTATHCNTLQHTATHCNTLQHTEHTAAHYNLLQHTATHSSAPHLTYLATSSSLCLHDIHTPQANGVRQEARFQRMHSLHSTSNSYPLIPKNTRHLSL